MKLVLQIAAGVAIAFILLALAQCTIVIGAYGAFTKWTESKIEAARIKESIKEHEAQEELAIKAQKSIELEKIKQIQQGEQERLQAENLTIAQEKSKALARKQAEFKKWYKPPPECEKTWQNWQTLMACTNDKMKKEKEFFNEDIQTERIIQNMHPLSKPSPTGLGRRLN